MSNQTSIKQLMTVDLKSIGPDTPVNQVASIFEGNTFHHIPVKDEDGNILGIITPEDLNRMPHFTQQQSGLKARHIMTASIDTVNENATVQEVADIFADKHYRSLPVVNNESAFVGLITTSDLLNFYRKDSKEG